MKVKDLLEKEQKVRDLQYQQNEMQSTLQAFDEVEDPSNNIYMSGISISGWPVTGTVSAGVSNGEIKQYKTVYLGKDLSIKLKSKIRVLIEEELDKIQREIDSIEI